MARRTRSIAGAAILGMLFQVLSSPPMSAGAPRTRWVDDDGRAGPRGCDASVSALRKVQAAIDASAAGDIVVVCPGRYRQNLSVGPGADRLTIRAATRGTAVIVAPASGGTAPLVSVVGATGTRLNGLVFRAPTTGACRRVSALLRMEGAADSRVMHARFEAGGSNTIGPCGYVDGIEVVAGAAARIDEVLIRDFRTHGILAADTGTSVIVEDSKVAFLHPTESPAGFTVDSIGIAVRSGALGSLRRDSVRSARTGGRTTPLLGSGILMYQTSNPVVSRAEVHHTLWAISLTATGGSVDHNVVHHGRALGGEVPIGLWIGGGTGADITANRVSGTAAGILMEGTGHAIHDNDFSGNTPHDCRDVTTGTGTAGTANTWTGNVGLGSSPTGICTPA